MVDDGERSGFALNIEAHDDVLIAVCQNLCQDVAAAGVLRALFAAEAQPDCVIEWCLADRSGHIR
jgi:hypothetical protein